MANGSPLSVADADKRLRKVIYGFWAACCSIFLGVLALMTVRLLPPGLALFFAGFFILLGIASFLIGLVELVRRSMGVKVHVEDQGAALYPSLGARRARQAMAAPGIGCAPIALIIEYALGDSTTGLIVTAVGGCIVSWLFFLTFVDSPYRRDAIHQGRSCGSLPTTLRSTPSPTKSRRTSRGTCIPASRAATRTPLPMARACSFTCRLTALRRTWSFDMTGAPMRFVLLRRLIDYFVDSRRNARSSVGRRARSSCVRS